MEKLSRGLSERRRRNSFNSMNNSISLELDLEDLEHFLLHLSKHTSDSDIAGIARDHFAGLAARSRSLDSSSELFSDELNEVITILSAFLSSAPGLPPTLVAQVHSYVGLIRERQQRHTFAIHSFLKVLWLQTSSKTTDFAQVLNVAVTENRLGLAYGYSGNYPQAISLLEKSLECYERAGLKLEHSSIVNVQAALSDFRSRHLQQALHLGNRITRTRHRLSHIKEDREYYSASERRLSQRW